MRGSTDCGDAEGRTTAIGADVPCEPNADTNTATATAMSSRMTTAPFDKLRERGRSGNVGALAGMP